MSKSKRWKQVFNGLLNNENHREELPPTQLPGQGPIPKIHEGKINTQIEKLRTNKATGPNQLLIDIMKLLKERRNTWMTACLNNIVYEKIPPDWKESMITPFYKQKGDPLVCRNYRGIRLLSHCLKLLERIIEQRIRNLVTIKQNQNWFHNGKSTTQPMFCLKILQEKQSVQQRASYGVCGP